MNKESRQNLVYRLSVGTFSVSTVLLFGFLIAQTYVRWVVNQNFTLLGGFELEALTLLVLGQTIALSYIYRSER